MSLRRFTGPATLLALLTCLPALHAATLVGEVSPCGPATLAIYQQNFGGQNQCSVGLLLMSGFSFASSGFGSPTLDTAADIFLTPATNGFSISQTNGKPFAVAQGQIALYTIGFNFFIDPTPILGDAGLSMDPPFGDATVTQAYCNDGTFIPGSSSGAAGVLCTNGSNIFAPQTLRVHNPDKLDDSIVFNPPAFVGGSVLTTIILNGSAGPAGFDQVTGTSTVLIIPDAPEPGTMLLAFGGLLTAGVWRKYKRV